MSGVEFEILPRRGRWDVKVTADERSHYHPEHFNSSEAARLYAEGAATRTRESGLQASVYVRRGSN